ncbi:hypothetical protein [Agromyces sp. Leaf222]|uniref:hypothetical protein n=1 Tax=Agromyces sp. Leaf222 TaxID=1735688 RepID=UPI0006FC0C4D|nr:hypothetical protein [Agromyces sp. Leaf222]KQM83426.1 hypothetical protein ASE68_09510 [Agromyces sp. Leaf222]
MQEADGEMTTDANPEAPRRPRAPTRAQSILGAAIVLVVGLLLMAGAIWIHVRTGGDPNALVGTGSGRSGGRAPAWFGIALLSVLAVIATALAIFTAVVGWRAAAAADRAQADIAPPAGAHPDRVTAPGSARSSRRRR